MYTILTDEKITRNRRVHYCIDPDNRVTFTAPYIRDCLDWLHENGHHTFYLDFGKYRVRVHRPQTMKAGYEAVTGWLQPSLNEAPDRS